MRRRTVWVIAVALAVTAMAGVAVWARLRVLAAYPEPVGIDGYWYATQLRALLENGRPADPTLPAALWFLTPFAAALGPVDGFKLGAAVGVSLHVATAFALGRALAKSSAAGLVAAAAVATSPGSIYLTSEFVKQGIALALVAGFLASWIAARERPGRGRIALAVASGAAAMLAHKLAVAIALAACAAMIADAMRRDPARRRWLVALAAFAAAAAAAFLVATRARWLGVVGGGAELSLPALRYPSGVALRFGHEAAAGGAVAILLVAVQLVRRRTGSGPLHESPIGWVLVALALFTALPWLAVGDPDGLGFRLRISAHFALAPLAGLLLVAVIADRQRAALAAVAIASLLLAFRPLAREEGVVRPNPALVAEAARIAATLPEDAELVTPDRQVAFLLTWQSRRPARTRPRDGELGDRTWRVVPAAWIDDESAAVLPPALLVVLPEATWQATLARLSSEARGRWDEWDQSGSLPPPRRSR
jgi:hypothetical protein